MRITFICPALNLSGGIKVTLLYADKLARMGHQVTVVSPARPKPPLLKRIYKFGQPQPPTPAFAGTYSNIILDTDRAVAARDVPDADVIVATWWATAEWIKDFPPEKGTKCYFIQHHETHWNLPVDRVKATYRLPMHKIVIAKWLKDVMRDEYGDDDVSLVPNSVDRTQFFAPPRDKQQRPSIGFLYNPAQFKGLDVALYVIETLRERMPDLQIHSFGSSTPAEIPDDSHFIYRPSPEQIRKLYAMCDLWLMTSRSEGFGLTALEAMACRTPVVSTPTGWAAEAIDGSNGQLAGATLDLAAACERVLTLPPEQWRYMSESAFKTSQRGFWDESAALFEAAIERAVTPRRRGTPECYRSPQDQDRG